MHNSFDMCAKVKEGYNHNNYNEKYRKNNTITTFEKQCLDLFLKTVPPNRSILDLGCGSAKTYDRYILSQGYHLIGVDFSEAQISKAKQNCPNGTFYCDNILTFPITPAYGGITLFYSLFHIHREQHSTLFQKLYANTASDCSILLNIRKEDCSEIKEKKDFCNYPMYWSHYSQEVFIEIIKEIGFIPTILGDEKNFGSKESHIWLILKKSLT